MWWALVRFENVQWCVPRTMCQGSCPYVAGFCAGSHSHMIADSTQLIRALWGAIWWHKVRLCDTTSAFLHRTHNTHTLILLITLTNQLSPRTHSSARGQSCESLHNCWFLWQPMNFDKWVLCKCKSNNPQSCVFILRQRATVSLI